MGKIIITGTGRSGRYLFEKLEFIKGFTIFEFLENHKRIANIDKITIK